jgi:hypothetical protein
MTRTWFTAKQDDHVLDVRKFSVLFTLDVKTLRSIQQICAARGLAPFRGPAIPSRLSYILTEECITVICSLMDFLSIIPDISRGMAARHRDNARASSIKMHYLLIPHSNSRIIELYNAKVRVQARTRPPEESPSVRRISHKKPAKTAFKLNVLQVTDHEIPCVTENGDQIVPNY